MGLDTEALCTKRLAPGGALQLRDAAGCTVMCCAGTVWITQENDARDIFLAAGEIGRASCRERVHHPV